MDFGIIDLDPDLATFWRNDVLPFMDEHLSEEVLEQERRLGNGFVPNYRRALAAKGWLTSGSTDPEAEPSALDPAQEAVVRAEEASAWAVAVPRARLERAGHERDRTVRECRATARW